VQRNRAKAVHNYSWWVARDGTKTFLRPFLKKEGRGWIQWAMKIKVVREATGDSPYKLSTQQQPDKPLPTCYHTIGLFVKSEGSAQSYFIFGRRKNKCQTGVSFTN